ncbi:hypothetical protein HDE_12572 [Halotydeus destructor]|nr:hypothetical protein HDE_12572 [Halotydeus destructor]
MPVHGQAELKNYRRYLMWSTTFFLGVTIAAVIVSFYELAQEEKIQESNIFYDPDTFRFNRFFLIGIGLMTILTLIMALGGAVTYSTCLLLTSGTTGNVLFIFLMIVLGVENLLDCYVTIGLIVCASFTIIGSLFVAYRISIYKTYQSVPLDHKGRDIITSVL